MCQLVGARLTELVGPDRLESVADLGSPALRLTIGRPPGPGILLLAHLDTVWDIDSFVPAYTVTDGIARGPGVFDMKGGLVIGAAALAALREGGWTGPEVTLLCTTD
jgi:glutamate carboxypeptidase